MDFKEEMKLALETADRFDLYFGHGQGWWLFGVLLQLAIMAGVVVLAVLVVQRVMDGAGGRATATDVGPEATRTVQDEALAELRLRYARGEISRDEYLQAAADLGSPVAAADETRAT